MSVASSSDLAAPPAPVSESKTAHELAQQAKQLHQKVVAEVAQVVVGVEAVTQQLLIALLSSGHVLLEGVPGLAKTLAVKTLASCVHTKFQRLQFTPDLLPADIIGTMIYNPRDGEFRPKLGPIFSNLILADEINRAPAKVQSALHLGRSTVNLVRQNQVGKNWAKFRSKHTIPRVVDHRPDDIRR